MTEALGTFILTGIGTMAIVLYAGGSLWLALGVAMFLWDVVDGRRMAWESKALILLGASLLIAAVELTLIVLVFIIFG